MGACRPAGCLRRLAPACVIGFGGYPSVPTMLAAVSLGLPTVIHEQNAVLGRANRLLAPRVRRIATGFSDDCGAALCRPRRAVHTGNPVRRGDARRGASKYKPPQRGGLNRTVDPRRQPGSANHERDMPPALAALPSPLSRDAAGQPTGAPRGSPAADAVYREHRIQAELQSFFGDVPERLARAHLVICRAGGLDDRRTRGDRPAGPADPLSPCDGRSPDGERPRICRGRSGWVISQAELRPDTLALYLENLLGDPPGARVRRRSAPASLAGETLRSSWRQLAVDLGIGGRPQGRAA